MALNVENIDQLHELSRDLKSKQNAEARMASLAARRLLSDEDERAIADSIRHPEYKEGAEIAYSYDCTIGTNSFEWTPGVYDRGEPAGTKTVRPYGKYGPSFTNYYSGTEGGYVIKPNFSLSLEINPDEEQHDTNLWSVVKSLSSKRFTEKLRLSIESSAPESLQILGLHNGLEIINPYDLQEWMQRAGVLEENNDFLPIKVLTRPPRKPEPATEADYPDRDDGLGYIVDQLFVEPELPTLEEGILNRPDEGSPRGVIETWNPSREIDDERLQNLIEIRDSWKDAIIVETESLVGDKAKYVALILPEPESTANVYGVVKEWAVAKNPLEGNALFIVNPYLLEEGATWRDVLLETTKKTAVEDGATRKIHTPDGKWKDRVLDIITAPQQIL